MDALDDEERQTLQALLESRPVALPTETVWGLASRWDDPAAVEELYERKGREPGKPVQLLCSSAEAALAFVDPVDRAVAAALARFWPGPLTLVVRANGLPEWMAPGGSVGLRVPRCATTQRVLAALPGGSAAATSLNRSGEAPASSYQEALAAAGSLADRVHPGPPAEGLASTVFIATDRRVAREGAVRLPDLLAALEGA